MIVFYIILFLILLFILKLELNAQFIARSFKNGNAIIYGKKRKGKDLIFQKVITKRKKEDYFANIPYGYKYHHIELNDISLSPNTYDDLINGTITKLKKDKLREKRDIYISDSGIHLPSHYNHILNKAYPSMPLYYSLSGHLYDSNVHCNWNGKFTRLWDKLREQADEYFRALKTVVIGPFIFTKLRYFEEQQACESNVLPFKKRFMAGHNNALQREFTAMNGEVRDMWIVQTKKKIFYDTRIFEKVFFTVESYQYRFEKKPIFNKLLNKIKKVFKRS